MNRNSMKTQRTDSKRSLKGEKARQAVLSRLADHVATRAVAEEVTSFFGSHFQYHESVDIDTSEFGLGNEPIIALIHLKLGTSRITQSLAHEFLHLRLAVRKFPRYWEIDAPDHLENFIPALSEYYDPLLNIVQHEIMLPEFVALGFQQKDFLVPPRSPENYQQFVRTPKNQIIPEIRFPWWCLEYIRHWSHAHHSTLLAPAQYASEALEFGKTEFPELPQAVTQITEVIENGHFKDASKYSSEVNKLLSIMRIPVITQWVEFSSEQPGHPIAKLIRTK
jgi:hypothetical protein